MSSCFASLVATSHNVKKQPQRSNVVSADFHLHNKSFLCFSPSFISHQIGSRDSLKFWNRFGDCGGKERQIHEGVPLDTSQEMSALLPDNWKVSLDETSSGTDQRRKRECRREEPHR